MNSNRRFRRLDVAAGAADAARAKVRKSCTIIAPNLHRVILGWINSFAHDRNPIGASPTASAATTSGHLQCKRFYRTRARASRPCEHRSQMRASDKTLTFTDGFNLAFGQERELLLHLKALGLQDSPH